MKGLFRVNVFWGGMIKVATQKKRDLCFLCLALGGLGGLFGGGPFAADGGDDGAFFLEGFHCFVHFFTVEAAEFCNLAGVERLSGLLHCV